MEESQLATVIQDLVDRIRDAGHTLVVFDQEDVITGDLIGGGKEGVVQHCQVRYHGILEPAALKTITNTDPQLLVYLLQEVELMSLGNDPIAESVLKIYGVVMLPSTASATQRSSRNQRGSNSPELFELGIVMERGLCNLLELIVKERPPLSLRVKIMAHWARALHHLHSGDPVIVHRDVKPQNVIVKEIVRADVSGEVVDVKIKLIDLGMGQKLVEGNMSLESIVGTEGFHAPEMWAEKPYSVQADIFSLGVSFMVLLFNMEGQTSLDKVMAEIHTLKENGSTGRSLFKKAKAHFDPEFSAIPDALVTIVVSMLKKVPYRETDLQVVYAKLDELSEALAQEEEEEEEDENQSARSSVSSRDSSQEEDDDVSIEQRSIACQVTSTPQKAGPQAPISNSDIFAIPRAPLRCSKTSSSSSTASASTNTTTFRFPQPPPAFFPPSGAFNPFPACTPVHPNRPISSSSSHPGSSVSMVTSTPLTRRGDVVVGIEDDDIVEFKPIVEEKVSSVVTEEVEAERVETRRRRNESPPEDDEEEEEDDEDEEEDDEDEEEEEEVAPSPRRLRSSNSESETPGTSKKNTPKEVTPNTPRHNLRRRGRRGSTPSSAATTPSPSESSTDSTPVLRQLRSREKRRSITRVEEEEECEEVEEDNEDEVVFISRNSAVRFEDEVEDGKLRRTSGVGSAAMERLCINAEDEVIIRSSASSSSSPNENEIRSLNRRLKQLENALKEKEEIISSQNEKRKEVEEELEVAKTELSEYSEVLKESEKELRDKDKESRRQEKELRQQEKEAKEKDKLIKELEKTLKLKEREIKEGDKLAMDREDKLKEREKELKEKEKVLKEKDRELRTKEKERANALRKLQTMEEEIESLRVALRGKEGEEDEEAEEDEEDEDEEIEEPQSRRKRDEELYKFKGWKKTAAPVKSFSSGKKEDKNDNVSEKRGGGRKVGRPRAESVSRLGGRRKPTVVETEDDLDEDDYEDDDVSSEEEEENEISDVLSSPPHRPKLRERNGNSHSTVKSTTTLSKTKLGRENKKPISSSTKRSGPKVSSTASTPPKRKKTTTTTTSELKMLLGMDNRAARRMATKNSDGTSNQCHGRSTNVSKGARVYLF